MSASRVPSQTVQASTVPWGFVEELPGPGAPQAVKTVMVAATAGAASTMDRPVFLRFPAVMLP